MAGAAQPSCGGASAVRDRIKQEHKAHAEQLQSVGELLGDQRTRTEAARQRVQELRALCGDIQSEVDVARLALQRKVAEQEKAKEKSRAKKGGTDGIEGGAQEMKRIVADAVRRTAPIFVQTLCKHNKAALKKIREGGGSKLPWRGKGKDPQETAYRTQHMRLEMPQGAMGPCREPAAGCTATLVCMDPQETQKRSLEDVAGEGATTRLVFTLRDDVPPDELQQLLDSAKAYFEKYFAARARDEGAVPEVTTQVSGRRLISTATVHVERGRVGGLLGKAQALISGELAALGGSGESPASRRSSMSSSPQGRATPPAAGRATPPAAGPKETRSFRETVLGPFSEEEAREALRLVQYTQLHVSVQMQRPFHELVCRRRLNWDYFNHCSGSGDVTLQRGVYKALQKVVDVFSSLAAAKMSLGGKFYDRMTFRLDGGLFRALREDHEVASFLERAMEKFIGSKVEVDAELLGHLSVLAKSVHTLDQFRVQLPGATLQIQFQGFDFFGLAADVAGVVVEPRATGQ
eukprot:TRINITY_DN14342_c0_g2_i1.p1 TRINITY_DN14342_c0_g2~~TRINITY_DN14342_c0_g2_i1.p1  ORF type:complete len:540 (+),score=141.00 TRINITY_DN14342_c0_g2_i1:61-1620(+)